MAWGTPLTATPNSVLTYTQWNASVRDNLNTTAPALATQSGSIFAGTGVNSIAERVPTAAYIGTLETTASTTYAALTTAGPTVSSLTSGTKVLVLLHAAIQNVGAGEGAFMSFDISGATTSSASDLESIRHTSATGNAVMGASYAYVTPVTAGSNTYTSKYRTTAVPSPAAFQARRLCIVPF